MPQIVQFFHPGGLPGNQNMRKDKNKRATAKNLLSEGDYPWNCGEHTRKFLKSLGVALDKNGNIVNGDFTFWGEWEANAKFFKTDAYPPYLFEAYISEEEMYDEILRQNTDPLVFGETWYYSNCKQPKLKTQLRKYGFDKLEYGSIIVFSSVKQKKTVIDTVFVVEKSEKYTSEIFQLGTILHDVTLKNFEGDLEWLCKDHILYSGKMFSKSTLEPYSFVPAKKFDKLNNSVFNQPVLNLKETFPELTWMENLGPNHGRNVYVSDVSEELAKKVWSHIKQAVLEADLLLGVEFDEPIRKKSASTVRYNETKDAKTKLCGTAKSERIIDQPESNRENRRPHC